MSEDVSESSSHPAAPFSACASHLWLQVAAVVLHAAALSEAAERRRLQAAAELSARRAQGGKAGGMPDATSLLDEWLTLAVEDSASGTAPVSTSALSAIAAGTVAHATGSEDTGAGQLAILKELQTAERVRHATPRGSLPLPCRPAQVLASHVFRKGSPFQRASVCCPRLYT